MTAAPPTIAIDDLAFEPPAGFLCESKSATLRAAPESGLPEAGLAGPVRPNLVIERRKAPRGATLAGCVARVEEDLVRSIPGLRGLQAVDIRFADGAPGVVLAYTFPPPRAAGVTIAQMQALRLDGDTLASIAITTTLAHLTETRRDQYLRMLASARLAEKQAEREKTT